MDGLNTLRLPHTVVHAAANSIVLREDRSISQKDFEQEFHCEFGTIQGDADHYYLTFHTEKAASIFLLKWA